VKPSPSAKIVDLTGKFVIPGMFDMHTHVDEPETIELKSKK
jgi:predicted amidohydrolase YtcJ